MNTPGPVKATEALLWTAVSFAAGLLGAAGAYAIDILIHRHHVPPRS